MAKHFESEATQPVPDGLSVQGGRIEAMGDGAVLRVGPDLQVIGRAHACAMVLDDPTVSAIHAEVQATPAGVRLRDVGSRNGLFIGERSDLRVVEVYLNGPCVFRCGARWLRFAPPVAEDILAAGPQRFGDLVGTTSDMRALFGTLHRFAASSVSMVIAGETGTGKERVARAIHEASPRRRKAFVAINCAALPDSLLEAELFGHVRGAFTGADRDRPGLLVEADGGTLLFDEVAEMSASMQAKLLRVLENGEVRPLGTERTRKVDVRPLFATHVDLAEAVNQGRFREDLYFRIAAVSVRIPPLRRRLEDMRLLVETILRELGRADVRVDDEAIARLQTRRWAGNVRELRSLVEVALVGCTGGLFAVPEGLPRVDAPGTAPLEALGYDEAKREFKRRYYTGLYAACRGNVTHMAKRAGKHRMTVRESLRELGLDAGAESGDRLALASAAGGGVPARLRTGKLP